MLIKIINVFNVLIILMIFLLLVKAMLYGNYVKIIFNFEISFSIVLLISYLVLPGTPFFDFSTRHEIIKTGELI
jgi:hypothetical protein